MKRIIIICEGLTEIEFCKKLLRSHFFVLNIEIQCWSLSGNISWGRLKNQIMLTLKQDATAYVTTFIDLYGLNKPELFPNWDDAILLKKDPYQRIEKLEQSMADAFHDNVKHRFIPNFILHEFEGLLFNELSHFESEFDDNKFKNKAELVRVLNEFTNPELINETKETSPSHRLTDVIFNKFSKTIDGISLAERIGLNRIRQKSAHFNEWISKLEKV